MRNKRKLTEEIIKHLPNSELLKVEDVYSVVWHNLRAGGGLRLTDDGYDIFCRVLNIEHWSYSIDTLELDTRMILALDRKLQNPYYLSIKKANKKITAEIVFFDSKEAVLASLYGNIKRFIDRYSVD